MKVYLIFLGEERSGTAPYGKVNREPRVTAAWTVPPLIGYSPTVSDHSRQSPGLVTETVDIPVTEIRSKPLNTNVALRSRHSLYYSAGCTGDHST